MRKALLFSALLFIFINEISLSQSGWFWQNPLPQGNYLYNVSFVNEQFVYISGAGGTLLKSTDSGNNLTTIQTGLDFDIGVNFINELTGFTTIYGDGFLRTTTGGTSWECFQIRSGYSTGTIQHISGIVFFALVASYTGNYKNTFIYKSTDLGNTWFPSFKPDTNT